MSLIASMVLVGHNKKHSKSDYENYPEYLPQDSKSMDDVIDYIKEQDRKEQKRRSIRRSKNRYGPNGHTPSKGL